MKMKKMAGNSRIPQLGVIEQSSNVLAYFLYEQAFYVKNGRVWVLTLSVEEVGNILRFSDLSKCATIEDQTSKHKETRLCK